MTNAARKHDQPIKQGQLLIQAAKKGRQSQVTSLLEEGADVTATDKDGFTALMTAAALGQNSILKELVQKVGAVNINSINPVDGNTALTLAAAEGQTEAAKLLLAKGADVNVKTNAGNTALMWLDISCP